MQVESKYSGMHAVVAEDSQHMRALLRSMLRALGFERVTAESNGADALRVVESSWPDVVLLDWNMPGISGIDVAKSIRTLTGPISRTPIVIVTAHASHQRLREARAAGVASVLCKPISIMALDQRLERVLRHPEVVEETARPAGRRRPADGEAENARAVAPRYATESAAVDSTRNTSDSDNSGDSDLETFYV